MFPSQLPCVLPPPCSKTRMAKPSAIRHYTSPSIWMSSEPAYSKVLPVRSTSPPHVCVDARVDARPKDKLLHLPARIRLTYMENVLQTKEGRPFRDAPLSPLLQDRVTRSSGSHSPLRAPSAPGRCRTPPPPPLAAT